MGLTKKSPDLLDFVKFVYVEADSMRQRAGGSIGAATTDEGLRALRTAWEVAQAASRAKVGTSHQAASRNRAHTL